MAGLQEVCATELLPLERVDGKHLAELLAAEGQEWLKRDSEISCELQADIKDGLTSLGISLPYLPRLTLSNIAVTDTGEVHGLELSIAELKLFQQRLYFLLHVLELFKGCFIYIEQFATGRNHTIPILLSELEGTIHEIAINGYQFVVIAILEVLPSEVVILSFRGIGCQYIAQHILLARHIYQILMEPYSPVA